MAIVVCMSPSGGLRASDEVGSCGDRRDDLRLTIRQDGTVAADYTLGQATRSLRLGLPAGRSEGLHLEPAHVSLGADGVVTAPNASQRFRIVLSPDPPERRWAGAYPLAFIVEGRGTAVYVPYLLPEGCGEVRVSVQGGRGVAAVVDGAYHHVEQELQILDPSGFVLLGSELQPDSTIQLPKTMPAWLGEAIRESYQHAQEELTALLGRPRKDVPLLVDFSSDGGDAPRNGGDASRGHCAMRLWFRGEAWEQHRAVLRRRMHDVLVHELVHCYQEPAVWRPWAHEGQARFVEMFLATRLRNEGSPDGQSDERFADHFDACMNGLRVSQREIDAYACGAVAYWLRWLETGHMNMLAEADAESGTWARTMAGRFLKRTVAEADIVDFVRSNGVVVEVVESVREAPGSVRWRLIMTLLRQGCAHARSIGYWTEDASIMLDAVGCPELNGFELQAVAGRHIINDVHGGYAAAAVSCRDEGRVPISSVGSDRQQWVDCDRSYEWPSTTGSRYRLVAPFSNPVDRR